jgi:hypothetical protein
MREGKTQVTRISRRTSSGTKTRGEKVFIKIAVSTLRQARSELALCQNSGA